MMTSSKLLMSMTGMIAYWSNQWSISKNFFPDVSEVFYCPPLIPAGIWWNLGNSWNSRGFNFGPGACQMMIPFWLNVEQNPHSARMVPGFTWTEWHPEWQEWNPQCPNQVLAFTRECHGFMNPCRLVLWVTVGAGMGCEFVTLTQPIPATRVWLGFDGFDRYSGIRRSVWSSHMAIQFGVVFSHHHLHRPSPI